MHIRKKYGNGLMNAVLLDVLPLILAFAGLALNHAAALQANTPANYQATATAEQEMKQSVEGVLATITQSGSTNARGYKVAIHNDGSATVENWGRPLCPSYRALATAAGSSWNDRYKYAAALADRNW
jgi:hypothetical protein